MKHWLDPEKVIGPVDSCPEGAPGVCFAFSAGAALAAALGATEAGASLAAIAATTAGTIGGTALAGAGIGALTGAATGGNIGQDALYGGLAGAVGGIGASAMGFTGADMAGGLGFGSSAGSSAAGTANAAGMVAGGAGSTADVAGIAAQLGTTVDANGILQSGTFAGMSATDPQVIAAATGSSASSAAGVDGVSNALTGSGGASSAGPLAQAAAQSSKGISNSSLALGALAGGAQLLGGKPKVASYATPGPSSTAATQGPYFNAPLQKNTGTGRTNLYPTAPTPGQSQAMYFGNNSLGAYGWGSYAKGGSVRHYDSGGSVSSTDQAIQSARPDLIATFNANPTKFGPASTFDEFLSNWYNQIGPTGDGGIASYVSSTQNPSFSGFLSSFSGATTGSSGTDTTSGGSSGTDTTSGGASTAPTSYTADNWQSSPYAKKVTNEYQQFLGRAPDASSAASYVNSLGAGGMTPSQMNTQFASSPEFQSNSPVPQTVDSAYQQFLKRTPTTSEAIPYEAQVASGNMQPWQLNQSILTSPEYAAVRTANHQLPSAVSPTWNGGSPTLAPVSNGTPASGTPGSAVSMACGGALNRACGGMMAQGGPEFSTRNGQHYVQGPGDGQSDSVKAALSDGEFVWDASTVSRLGNGSNRKGAAVLERARQAIAHDAGSPRVVQKKIRKDPLQYLAEARRG